MLGKEYQVPENENQTKEKILVKSARLFAIHGYFAVSVRDIAKEVGLKPGSLYNHYESKEALLDSIFDRFDLLYDEYLRRLRQANEKAASVHEVLENVFIELKNLTNIFNFYGMALVIKEQFYIPRARDIYINKFFGLSLDLIDEGLQDIIQKGHAKPFDTRSVAMLSCSATITACCLTIHRQLGHSMPHINLEQGYDEFIAFLSDPGNIPG